MGIADQDECTMMEGLDDHAMGEVAEFFGALAVPMRLKILNALRHGERNVGDLTAQFGCSQANVSKHLALLARKGLIAKTLRGTSSFYRVVDPRIYKLCDLVCVQVGERIADQMELKNALLAVARAAGEPPPRKRHPRA